MSYYSTIQPCALEWERSAAAALYAQWNWFAMMRPYEMRPYKMTNFDGHAVPPEQERALERGDGIHECAADCPVMIVVPAGDFWMGSAEGEDGRYDNESPRHHVVIGQKFAVSQNDVTFDEWDACAKVGGCPANGDLRMGRGAKPAVNMTFDEAKRYAAWLSLMTEEPYQLLTESESEYAARAGTTTAYFWESNDIGKNNADCSICGSKWDGHETSPVGSFKANAYGLFDMAGDVWQWVDACITDRYNDDGGVQANRSGVQANRSCGNQVVRGGSWNAIPRELRSAYRGRIAAGGRGDNLGFRVGRVITP